MRPINPHKKSWKIRRFKPTRKPAGVFGIGVVFLDAALLLLVFFLVVSPFVLQPGINVVLPSSPFTGGAQFGSMVLAITRDGWFYFNDERCLAENLETAFRQAAEDHPGAPLIIEADKRVPHGTVVKAWNAALAAGIKEVSLATQISAATEDIQ
ncbi:MAG: biopolymer transporter ExbD [Kiritimatiellales bacterium]|nr:biopolymer transporter ExbD [Kiritimatiellales bacterium]